MAFRKILARAMIFRGSRWEKYQMAHGSFKTQINEFLLEEKFWNLMAVKNGSAEWSNGSDAPVVIVCADDPCRISQDFPFGLIEATRFIYCDNITVLLSGLARLKARSVILFFEVESFGGVDKTFEDLRFVRDSFSAVKIIFISKNFLVDDFSLERLPLCDVSLRWPASRHSMMEGLDVARENNQIWAARLEGILEASECGLA